VAFADPVLPRVPHPLRSAAYRRLWIGGSISLLGDQFYFVSLPWLVLQLTGSALAMSTILMTGAIPRAVLMLMGGALSDRLSPRRIMIGTALSRTVLVTAIGALLAWHSLHMWELYLLAFTFGVADAFAMPASSAYLPLIVEREQLVQANSVSQTTGQLVTIAGPAPAAIVLKTLGAAWAFFLDALSFLAILAALWTLPDPPARPKAAKKPMWRSIVEGIRAVRSDQPLSVLMLMATVINFCLTGPIAVGLPDLASSRFHSPTAFAVLLSSVASGGLLGALLAGVWKIHHKGLLMLGGSAFIGLCIASIGLLPKLWLIAAILLLTGIAAGLVNLHILTWIQQRVDAATRGRVMSVLMVASIGLMPLSLAAGGVLAQWSLKWMFVIAGVATMAVAAAATRLRTLREIS
jgi:MFS family permease